MIATSLFFGDKERSFSLTDDMVIELEAKTGTGIGTLFQRLMAQSFKLTDLSEVIRLGLIAAAPAPRKPTGW